LHPADKKWIQSKLNSSKLGVLNDMTKTLPNEGVMADEKFLNSLMDRTRSLSSNSDASDIKQGEALQEFLEYLNIESGGCSQRLSSLKAFVAENIR